MRGAALMVASAVSADGSEGSSGGGVATSRSKAAHSSSSIVDFEVDEGGGIGWEGSIVDVGFFAGGCGCGATCTFPTGGLALALFDSIVSSSNPLGASVTGFVFFRASSSPSLAFRFLLLFWTVDDCIGSVGLDLFNRNLSRRIACCVDFKCLFHIS